MIRLILTKIWQPGAFRWGLIALVALALGGAAIAAQAYPGPAAPTRTPVARGVLLAPENQPDVYNKLPPDKRAVVDRENEMRNQALRNPMKPGEGRALGPSTDERVTPSTPHIGPPHRAAGAGIIIEVGCGQEYRSHNLNTNRWIEQFADRRYMICGGAIKGEPAQGVLHIAVMHVDGDGQLPQDQQLRNPWFPTPKKAGEVKITDAVGEVLTLQAKDGTLFYFDVGSLRYVDGPPRPAPEKTPSP